MFCNLPSKLDRIRALQPTRRKVQFPWVHIDKLGHATNSLGSPISRRLAPQNLKSFGPNQRDCLV